MFRSHLPRRSGQLGLIAALCGVRAELARPAAGRWFISASLVRKEDPGGPASIRKHLESITDLPSRVHLLWEAYAV